MAVLTRSRAATADAAGFNVPRLVDDPEYQAAQELLSVFNDRLGRLERERDRAYLEHHFGNRHERDDGPADQELRARLRQLQREEPLTRSAPISPAGAPAAVEVAVGILRGEPLPPPQPDTSARLAAIDRQIVLMREAIFAQAEVRDAIGDRLGYEYAQRIKASWYREQVALFRCAQEFARQADKVRRFTEELLSAGVRNDSTLIAPPVRSPLTLGSEANPHSEISEWRRILEQRGVL